jgi:hypothetical protein
MGYIPSLLLIYIWLIVGRADPGGILEEMPVVRWLSYPTIFGMCLIALIFISYIGKIKTGGIGKHIILILAILFFSMRFSENNLFNVAYGAMLYLRYPLLFIVLLNFNLSDLHYKRFIKLFLLITALLIPEAILNFVLFGKYLDITFSSLGGLWGTAAGGIFFAYASCLVMAYVLLDGLKKIHVAFFLLMYVASIIASIRSVIAFLPFILLFIWAVKKDLLRIKGVIAFSAFISGVVLLATMIPWGSVIASFPILKPFTPHYRLAYISGVLSYLASTGKIFLGAGPGSMNPGSFGSIGFLYQMLLEENNLAGGGTNQYVRAFADFGIIGFTIYWAMLIKMIRINMQVWNFIKNKNTDNEYYQRIKVISLAFFGIWIHYSAIGLFNNDVWRFDISSLVFWVFAAYIYSIRQWLQTKS